MIKGPCEPAELKGLKTVAQQTSIPILKVHQIHCIDGHLEIEMEYNPDPPALFERPDCLFGKCYY